jgi:hypothetical protein
MLHKTSFGLFQSYCWMLGEASGSREAYLLPLTMLYLPVD